MSSIRSKLIAGRPLVLTTVALMSLCLVLSCGDSSDTATAGPRREALHAITDTVILPTYRSLVAALDQLVIAAEELEIAPDLSTLRRAQEAWRVARQPWKQSEAFRLGPSEDLRYRSRSKMDWSPIVPARIEEQVAGSAELTAEYIDTLGTNRRGFLAIEYLIFDSVAGDDAVLARLTGIDGERRRQFVRAVAQDISRQAVRLLAAWDPTAENFRIQFIEAGHDTPAFKSLKEALDTLVGAMVVLSVNIEENRIGRPFGTKSNGEPRPEEVDTRLSGNATADILDNLQSIENVYLGTYSGAPEQGLRNLVFDVSPEIDAGIREAIANAKLALEQLSMPLDRAVIEERQAVGEALAAATELRRALSIDMVSALGSTPRFVGDGD